MYETGFCNFQSSKLQNRNALALLSLIPIAWDAILALIGVKLSQMLTLVLGTALLAISTVLQIIAGVKGINASTRPEKAPGCVKIGIVIIALAVLSNILGALAPEGKFDIGCSRTMPCALLRSSATAVAALRKSRRAL